jgi:hypothetical protein
MSRPPEPRWTRFLLGHVIFAGVVTLAAAPIYVFASAEHRPTIVRLAASAVVAILLVNVQGRLRNRLSGQATSAFETARRPVPVAPRLDRRFHELRAQVRFGIARDRYFAQILWPWLRTMISKRPSARTIERPPGRRFGRGPSAKAIAELLTISEEDR